MKKIVLIALVGAALVVFVGTDVVKGALTRAREEIRSNLTAHMPLDQQVAEARALVDRYAESVIKGEVAAENLAEMIQQVEREVRVLDTRVENERLALVRIRRDLEVVPTSTLPREEERTAARRVQAFKAQAQLLDRRRADLSRLKKEYGNTMASLGEAKAEQQRLAEEVHALSAEIESLEARTAAARTREAVGNAIVSSSGYAEAQKKLKEIRSSVKERNKLLAYYEVERRPVRQVTDLVEAEVSVDPRGAIDEALAAWPKR